MRNIVNSIKYVGIDLDDTLYDRDNVYKNTFYIMEKEVVCTNNHFSKFNKIFQKYSIIEFDRYTVGKKNKLSYKLDRVKLTYEKLGKTISEEEALIFHSLYEYFRNNITLRPDALEFIQLIKEQHLEPFILTNGPSEDQREKIRALELDKIIDKDRIFISSEIGFAKPDKRIFNYVEEELETSGKRILYVGDHMENDILASIQNNWNSVYFEITKQGTDVPNVLTVNNFKSLFNIFNKQNLPK